MSEKEIKKLFSSIKGKISPSKELSRRILADLSLTEEKEKGRISKYELILNQTHILMTKWKIVVPVVLVVLVVAGLMILRFGKESQPTIETSLGHKYVQVPNEVPVPKATGNIDDIIGAMTAFAENEQIITIEEGNDASIVVIDGQEISDFGQSYNENEF